MTEKATKKKSEKTEETKHVEPTLETAAPAPAAEAQAIEVRKETALAVAAPSQSLTQRMADIDDNLESVEDFQMPRVRMTASGFELIEGQPHLLELEGVLVYTKKTNTYYEKPYKPGDKKEPPTCYSLDGVKPDPSIEKPQHATCKGCPKAEYGTNAMKAGKACRNLKPLFLLLGDEALVPRQLNITPTSLKAANQYLMNLTERGLSYRNVRTKLTLVKDNPNDPYFKVKFDMGRKLGEQEAYDAKWLRDKWLSVMDSQIGDALENQETVNVTPEGQAAQASANRPEEKASREFTASADL